jgi:Alr-MurF fusion protein
VKLTSGELARIVNGKLTGSPDLAVNDLVTDSRQITMTEGMAFFAISGRNHDGHFFVENLYNKGVRIFIVEKMHGNFESLKNASFITVLNTIEALQLVGAYRRKGFKSPVIAITGSSGKTIVKEWLADILGLSTSVVRSPKSYNSQIGVPLSVWMLDEKYKLAIIEAGISLPGEMEKIQKVIDPDIGVLTNIGDAHSENFRNNEAKAKEKIKLFGNVSKLIYCSDQVLVRKLISKDKQLLKKEIIDWSFENRKAAIFVKITTRNEGRTMVEMIHKGTAHEFLIPFTDGASIENSITVASTCLALGVDPEIIRRGLAGLVSVAMRMELKTGINNCQLIEDYYNSDPGSLGMALEYLKSQNNRKTILLLSDFVQSGRDEKDLYSEVAGKIKNAGIDRFIGIGPALLRNKSLFAKDSVFFLSTEEFMHSFKPSDFRNNTILLKGARIFEFEKISNLLELQVHQTVLEVNLDAISHNLNEFRQKLDQGTRIMAMVKAFAYGAGPSEIASLLEFHRVSYLGVAYADEGVQLRNAGVTLPVMVMNPDPYSSELMVRYNLEPELYSFHSLERFSEVAAKHGVVQYPVHIKIDSGMHRLGFMPEEFEELALRIKEAESIKIISVFSHLAAAEDPAFDDFTHKQVEVFLKAVEIIREATGYPFLRHICNSAAIVRFPQYQFEMVRPGIGIYGAGELAGLSLKPAARFRTKISQIKKIPGGDPVGYGCADVSEKERLIAILPVGYADGLNRRLGNRNGNLWIRSTRAPIIGNICMDMCMADVTGLNAEIGDEAEIFGEKIPISELAEKCQTIPYEILTSIPGRVKRVFFRG